MGRKCLTCQHAKYKVINRLLVEGLTPLSSISRKYGMSVDSLRSHQQRCIHLNLRRAQERREMNYEDELLEIHNKCLIRLKRNLDVLDDVTGKARKSKHHNVLLKSLKETRSTLELTFKMLASINAGQRAETDISMALRDGRLGEIVQDLSTPELAVLRKVFSRIMDRTSVPMIEVGNGGVIDVNGGGASEVEEDDLEADIMDAPLMVRTRYPKGEVEDIDHNKVTEGHAPDPVIAQTDGGEDDVIDMDKPDKEGLTQRQRKRKRPFHEIAW